MALLKKVQTTEEDITINGRVGVAIRGFVSSNLHLLSPYRNGWQL